MKQRCAWMTITGKVFISQDEVDLLLDQEDQEQDQDIVTEEQAFEKIAKEKIEEKFCMTDDPVKVEEVEIDMSTFH